MKRKILLIILLFFYFISFSQSLQYLDEKMMTIDSLTYSKKCKSVILKCLNFKTTALNLNKVLYKYKFGTIDTLGFSQLRKLLIRNSNQKINKNAFLIISYSDSLRSFKVLKKNYEKHVKKHSTISHKPYNYKSFLSSRKNWIKGRKKCEQKFKKFNTETFYVYKHNNDSLEEYPEINWIKDSGLFKNAFFKIIYNSNFLLVKPNGEYFISGGHLPNKLLKKLLKNKDWSEFKLDWQLSYNSLSYSGKGVFKKSINHTKHCY